MYIKTGNNSGFVSGRELSIEVGLIFIDAFRGVPGSATHVPVIMPKSA